MESEEIGIGDRKVSSHYLALGQEADLLRSILDSVVEGVVVADQHGRFLFFNTKAETILGIGAQNISQQEWTSTYGCFLPDTTTPFPPEHLPLSRSLRGEEVLDELIFIKNPQQSEGVWISTSSSPLRDGDGEVGGGVVIFRDVTERYKALEKITLEGMAIDRPEKVEVSRECITCLEYFSRFRGEYELLAKAVEQTGDSVVITNKQGVIEYVNPSFERTTGYDSDEVLGKTPRILQSGRHKRDFYKKLWGTLLRGEHFRGTIVNKKKNGELYWAEQTITPIKNDDGQITNFVSVLKDITEMKRRQEQEFQLNIAHNIQQQLYRSDAAIPGFDIYGAAYPANETGGDYFDFIQTSDGCLWVAIGDVSGHGIGSAIIMATTRAYVRSFVKQHPDPGTVLTNANRELAGDLGEGRFVTLLLARLDLDNRLLQYASAGHVPGYVMNNTGKVRRLVESTGIPMGYLREYQFRSGEAITLTAGDLVVFLTDGITEAIAMDESLFGFERAIKVVEENRREPAQTIIQKLYQRVQEFSGYINQKDDVTSVIVKVNPSSEA